MSAGSEPLGRRNHPHVGRSPSSTRRSQRLGRFAAVVKPISAKTQAKPVVAAKPVASQPAARMKPVPPKAVLSHAPAGSQRVPTTAARQFGQAAAALAAPKAAAQKAMLSRQQPAPSKQAAADVAAAKKPVNQRHGFKTNEWIVYPAHGVGRIVGIEEQEIAGMSLELFVITFEKDKMTLRVPTGKSASGSWRRRRTVRTPRSCRSRPGRHGSCGSRPRVVTRVNSPCRALSSNGTAGRCECPTRSSTGSPWPARHRRRATAARRRRDLSQKSCGTSAAR